MCAFPSVSARDRGACPGGEGGLGRCRFERGQGGTGGDEGGRRRLGGVLQAGPTTSSEADENTRWPEHILPLALVRSSGRLLDVTRDGEIYGWGI